MISIKWYTSIQVLYRISIGCRGEGNSGNNSQSLNTQLEASKNTFFAKLNMLSIFGYSSLIVSHVSSS